MIMALAAPFINQVVTIFWHCNRCTYERDVRLQRGTSKKVTCKCCGYSERLSVN